MSIRFGLITLAIFFGLDSFGQESGPGAWYIYNGSFFVKPSKEFFFETQTRLREPLGNKQEIFFRPIFIHHFNSKWNAGLGYTLHLNYADGTLGDNTLFSFENRIILQAQIYTPVQRTFIQHRLRLEQRWITTTSNSETNTRQRFRYRFQATVPLGHKKVEKGVFFLNFYNEIFINLQVIRSKSIVRSNRISIYTQYQFSVWLVVSTKGR